MDLDAKSTCILCVVGTLLVVGIILFATSWDTVEPTEYAIPYNSISKNIGHEVYDGGRYLIGLTYSFIKFPRTVTTIEFSNSRNAQSKPLSTRTREGLALSLMFSFQYELQKDRIPDLYAFANRNYESTFVRMARDVILTASGEYDAPQYWLNRTIIGEEMRQRLDAKLNQVFAHCVGLQMLEIGLPESYEDYIVQTQVEKQNKTIKEFEQQASMIRQQILVDNSEAQRNITMVNATASANATLINQQAQATSRNNTINTESGMYAYTSEQTGLTGENLNRYIYYLNLLQNKGSKLLYGLGSNVMLNLNTV